MPRIYNGFKFHILKNEFGRYSLSGDVWSETGGRLGLKITSIGKPMLAHTSSSSSFEVPGFGVVPIDIEPRQISPFAIQLEISASDVPFIKVEIELDPSTSFMDVNFHQPELSHSFFVHGGCTSRDTFENPYAPILADYRARSSLVAAFDPHLPRIPSTALEANPSSFQQRMLEAEFNRELPITLEKAQFDFILFDFLIERSKLGLVNNATVTLSPEFIKTGLSSYLDDELALTDLEYLKLFESAWSAVLNIVPQEKIIVNKVLWADKFSDGSKTENQKYINDQNSRLHAIYEIIERLTPNAIFLNYAPELLVGDVHHKWGKAPYHFGPSFYEAQLKMLGYLTDHGPKSLLSDDCSSQGSLIQLMGRKSFLQKKLTFKDLNIASNFDLEMLIHASPDIDPKNLILRFKFQNTTDLNSEISADELKKIGIFQSPHPNVGWYSYIRLQPSLQVWKKSFELPKGILCTEISLVRWNNHESKMTISNVEIRTFEG